MTSTAHEHGIRLRTEIPGPRSRAFLERRAAVLPRSVNGGIPICIARAAGALVTDVDDNRFIDFAGGIGVLNLGHAPAKVQEAISAQAADLIHSCFTVAGYESYVALAEALVAMTPGTFAKKVVLASTGAEAVENAIKIARASTGRDAVVAFSHAFHGRTLLTMTLTAKHAPYKKGFGPFAPEIYRAPLPYVYHGTSVELATASFTQLIEDEIGPECVAAVIIEPVAGEGGYIPVPAVFLRMLREVCDRIGAVLIFDEIQTGFGRTGTMFACEQSGVDADLLCLAKSIAAGLPLGAVVGRSDIMDGPVPGGLGGTYAGNPVACAAALASLELMRDPGYLRRAVAIGEIVNARFTDMYERHPIVGEVRALGPMAALEFVTDRTSKSPAAAACEAVWRYAYEHGLITVRAGSHNNVIRFVAPLVISDADLRDGLDVLDQAIAEAATGDERK